MEARYTIFWTATALAATVSLWVAFDFLFGLGGTLPGHKPARLDIGRNDLACRLDLQVCTLNPVLPRLPAARVVRRARKVLSSRSIADESPSP